MSNWVKTGACPARSRRDICRGTKACEENGELRGLTGFGQAIAIIL